MSFVAGGTVTLLQENKLQIGGKMVNETGVHAGVGGSGVALSLVSGPKSSAALNDRAMQHPLCVNHTTTYVGQTAKMYCCLARLDRELSVSNGAS